MNKGEVEFKAFFCAEDCTGWSLPFKFSELRGDCQIPIKTDRWGTDYEPIALAQIIVRCEA